MLTVYLVVCILSINNDGDEYTSPSLHIEAARVFGCASAPPQAEFLIAYFVLDEPLFHCDHCLAQCYEEGSRILNSYIESIYICLHLIDQ